MRVIDADAHVVEGSAFAAEALRRWPDRVQVDSTRGVLGLRIEGRRVPEFEGPGAGCPPQHGLSEAVGGDPSSVADVLADADREGIDEMVLYPSLGLGVGGFRDPEFAAGFARLYNTFVTDFCKQGSGRLHPVAVVPLEDPDTSCDIVREARSLGCVAVAVPPALRERNLDHPDLDRFWSTCEDLDLAVGVHGAPGVHLPQIGVERFTNYIQVHCVSFPFDQMVAMTAVVSGGVLDRHPRLRIAFLESGVTWVPYFVDRLHEHWEKRGAWIEGGWQRDPRDYVGRGQVFVSCEGSETLLPAVVEALGDEFILYASDYPHWDSEFPESAKPIREHPKLSEDARARILGGNARRLYGL